jgi:hypothetical protein
MKQLAWFMNRYIKTGPEQMPTAESLAFPVWHSTQWPTAAVYMQFYGKYLYGDLAPWLRESAREGERLNYIRL